MGDILAGRYYTSAQLKPYKNGFRAQLNHKNSDGKWTNVSRVLASTNKRDAKIEMEDWHREMEELAANELNFSARTKGDITVGAYTEDYVDKLEGSHAVEKSTIFAYRSLLKYIKYGSIGKVKFKDVNSENIQIWVNEMVEDGYAASSVKKTYNLLKAALTIAFEDGLLAKNPFRRVKLPKLPSPSPNSLDASQRERILRYLDNAAKTPINLAIYLALYTGMREGELCGLKWKNVDLWNKTILVRTVVGRDGTSFYLKEPKTGASRRDIPISDDIIALLNERHAIMVCEAQSLGVEIGGEHFVLGEIDGRFIHPTMLWKNWKAIARSMGLVGTQGRVPSFHDLRHTFATTAVTSGVDIKSVASILGHSNAAMTLNIYASADPDAKRQASERVSEALRRD